MKESWEAPFEIKKEFWFETQYAVIPFDRQKIVDIKNSLSYPFALPKKNIFIPESLKLLSDDENAVEKYIEKV
jgi:secreted Zn-dependent insulinase-like peptidase